jgi:xylulose-5-phosphate/fructose-6-phosphate phosphoketolase
MIVLRSPKGWTAPKEVDGHRIEGSWRAHQVPDRRREDESRAFAIVERVDAQLSPEELFDESGAPIAELAALPPLGDAPDEREPARKRRSLAQTARAARFSRVRGRR